MANSKPNYDGRINFLPDLQIMEVDFSNITFAVSRDVNAFYDEVDRRISETGQKWYFLVNYQNCRIMAEAWITFHQRGKNVNIAYSLGSVRFAATSDTGASIVERSRKEKFDANLFASREAAVAHIAELRRGISDADFKTMLKPSLDAGAPPASKRVKFHDDLQVMEVDFRGVVFENSRDVNAFYDVIDRAIEETGKDWYFLVDYRDCEILPDAWMAFALRGKKVNLAHSLGTVRFGSSRDTREEIARKSTTDDFDPNLVATRDEALARIAVMKTAPK